MYVSFIFWFLVELFRVIGDRDRKGRGEVWLVLGVCVGLRSSVSFILGLVGVYNLSSIGWSRP